MRQHDFSYFPQLTRWYIKIMESTINTIVNEILALKNIHVLIFLRQIIFVGEDKRRNIFTLEIIALCKLIATVLY